jgi:hypothetical protein
MKILILIVLLNAQTGDIEQGAIIGTTHSAQECMQIAAQTMERDKKVIGERVPFPLCIDIEPMIPTKDLTKS